MVEPYGFTFMLFHEGSGSGGEYAAGRFSRDAQSIELHLRYALGIVTYRWGEETISHAEYMRSLGVKGEYPGFSHDLLDGFRHLAADLKGAAAEFLRGNDREGFKAACREAGKPRERWLP